MTTFESCRAKISSSLERRQNIVCDESYNRFNITHVHKSFQKLLICQNCSTMTMIVVFCANYMEIFIQQAHEG